MFMLIGRTIVKNKDIVIVLIDYFNMNLFKTLGT